MHQSSKLRPPRSGPLSHTSRSLKTSQNTNVPVTIGARSASVGLTAKALAPPKELPPLSQKHPRAQRGAVARSGSAGGRQPIRQYQSSFEQRRRLEQETQQALQKAKEAHQAEQQRLALEELRSKIWDTVVERVRELYDELEECGKELESTMGKKSLLQVQLASRFLNEKKCLEYIKSTLKAKEGESSVLAQTKVSSSNLAESLVREMVELDHEKDQKESEIESRQRLARDSVERLVQSEKAIDILRSSLITLIENLNHLESKAENENSILNELYHKIHCRSENVVRWIGRIVSDQIPSRALLRVQLSVETLPQVGTEEAEFSFIEASPADNETSILRLKSNKRDFLLIPFDELIAFDPSERPTCLLNTDWKALDLEGKFCKDEKNQLFNMEEHYQVLHRCECLVNQLFKSPKSHPYYAAIISMSDSKNVLSKDIFNGSSNLIDSSIDNLFKSESLVEVFISQSTSESSLENSVPKRTLRRSISTPQLFASDVDIDSLIRDAQNLPGMHLVDSFSRCPEAATVPPLRVGELKPFPEGLTDCAFKGGGGAGGNDFRDGTLSTGGRSVSGSETNFSTEHFSRNVSEEGLMPGDFLHFEKFTSPSELKSHIKRQLDMTSHTFIWFRIGKVQSRQKHLALVNLFYDFEDSHFAESLRLIEQLQTFATSVSKQTSKGHKKEKSRALSHDRFASQEVRTPLASALKTFIELLQSSHRELLLRKDPNVVKVVPGLFLVLVNICQKMSVTAPALNLLKRIK